MITLEAAIAKIKQLPTEDQKEIIRFIEFLEFKSGKAIPPQDKIEITEPKPISFAEAARDLIGCLDGLPPDLSTNKAYMEGFGQ
ncbi:hypothetical protein V2H45_23985 [Tumidithrix elongata RA019]|uniref:DUF2281 domain-containing protein n=1 Tax=Tumidithrix elongata BACA0141 TaxID=2716417 RepID=A0AAW9Q3F4_9CYAN|nr:hypothetical protein [Tumidithrix elongata RA019]